MPFIRHLLASTGSFLKALFEPKIMDIIEKSNEPQLLSDNEIIAALQRRIKPLDGRMSHATWNEQIDLRKRLKQHVRDARKLAERSPAPQPTGIY